MFNAKDHDTLPDGYIQVVRVLLADMDDAQLGTICDLHRMSDKEYEGLKP